MKKIIIFLILILLSIFIDVKAAGITINNKYYNISGDISGNGFFYDVSKDVLELNNYNGGPVICYDGLNIIVKGDNYIISNSTLPLIRSDDLMIDGDGTLNFNAPGVAIYSDKITIKNVSLKGTSGTEFISVTNSFSLDNVKIEAESGSTLLYGGSNNVISNSVIKSSNKWGLRYATNSVTNIYNSDITMECSSICINSVATLNFSNTKALFHGKTYASANIKMNFNDGASYLVSYDGTSYQESSNYNSFPYLKINGVLDNDVDKDDEDENKEKVNENDSLDNPNKDQGDLEDDSSNNGNTSDSIKDSDSISSDSTSTNDKSDDSTNTDDNFDKPGDNVDKNNATNDKEDDDLEENNDSNINQGNDSSLENNNFDNDIGDDSDKESGDISIDDVYTNNEYQDNEIYTDSEYDNDWTVEVENPKTYDGIGYKVFWLAFSLAGIIALAFLMRYLNGKI